MKSVLNWFEIPVTQLDRAVLFYETMLSSKLKCEQFNGKPMAVMMPEGEGVGGALVEDQHWKPRLDGTLVYLNANGQLEAMLSRVERAGGKVLLPKTSIGEPGFIALVQDPDGNRIGLHAQA